MASGEVDAAYPGQPISSMAGVMHQSGISHVITNGSRRSTSTSSSDRPTAQGGTHSATGAILLKNTYFGGALAMGLNRKTLTTPSITASSRRTPSSR